MVPTMSNTPTTQQEMLTPAQAAEYLGVTTRTLRRYLKSGALKRTLVLPSGHARFARVDLEEMKQAS